MDKQKAQKNGPVKPKKRLGQNFLAEIGVIQKLVAAAALNNNESVLEIGPGTGNLTAELVKTGRPVIAVEKDPEMAAIVKEKFRDAKNFRLELGDALSFDETKIDMPYKIAANLPFYAAAPIIRKFLESHQPPLSLTVIVQKEVAQRICAKPPKMNLLAASVQFYGTPKIIGYVSKGSFWPAPKVDGAILHIAPFCKTGEQFNAARRAGFFKVMKAGFSQPRKQLAGNLSRRLGIEKGQAAQLLTKNHLDPKQRPETLSVENWISLADSL